MRQFCHILTGLAAKWDFGDQRNSSIMGTLIQNVDIKMVQQKLFRQNSEPKEGPQEAFRLAVAYEEGESQQKEFEGARESKEVKQEPTISTETHARDVNQISHKTPWPHSKPKLKDDEFMQRQAT